MIVLGNTYHNFNIIDQSNLRSNHISHQRSVGWVARSKTQHHHTNILEMLGFILQPNLQLTHAMINCFAPAPPSAQADASRTNEFADATTRRFPPHVLHQAGANSESSLFAKRLEEKKTA